VQFKIICGSFLVLDKIELTVFILWELSCLLPPYNPVNSVSSFQGLLVPFVVFQMRDVLSASLSYHGSGTMPIREPRRIGTLDICLAVCFSHVMYGLDFL